MADLIECDCRGLNARHNGQCAVLREAKLFMTKEGRTQLMEEYGEQVRKASGRPDVFSQLQKMGAPMDALLALRRNRTDTKAMDGAKKFCQAKELATMLVLLGPTGTGKTVAAVAVLEDFAKRHEWNNQATGSNQNPAMFVDASRIAALTAWRPEDGKWLDSMLAAQLLVLDEAGREGTPWGREALADLCMTRHNKRRRTVITANLRWDAFVERYGAPLADRVKGAGVVPSLWNEKSMRAKQ